MENTMKKYILLILCLALAALICGCGTKTDPQVEAVRERILALPTAEQFQQLTEEARQEAYLQVQLVYEDYMALNEQQRQQIPEAEGIFEVLFSWINAQVMPLEETAPETEPETIPETTLPDVVILTEEEQALLLQIAMAERGSTGCVDCMALVMNTVLNRVADLRFPSSIRNVIYAQDQFTPVTDGTFAKAQPDDLCRDALERIIKGWDESQGALYYEWCQGESWHSKNLHLLFQHCDTRFYA